MLEHARDRPGCGLVVGIAGEKLRELLLVGDAVGAEAGERGVPDGVVERGGALGAHLAQALGEELGVSGLALRDGAEPAPESVQAADGDPGEEDLGGRRFGGTQVIEKADDPVALHVGVGHAPSRSRVSRIWRSQRMLARSSSRIVASNAWVSASPSTSRTMARSGSSSGPGSR